MLKFYLEFEVNSYSCAAVRRTVRSVCVNLRWLHVGSVVHEMTLEQVVCLSLANHHFTIRHRPVVLTRQHIFTPSVFGSLISGRSEKSLIGHISQSYNSQTHLPYKTLSIDCISLRCVLFFLLLSVTSLPLRKFRILCLICAPVFYSYELNQSINFVLKIQTIPLFISFSSFCF